MSAFAQGWVAVCRVEDLPGNGARVIERGRGVAAVAVFRCEDGSVFAVEDRCPHRGGPLSQGIVYGHRVACPLHNWSIELATGEAAAPDKGCTRAYPVRIADGRVFLEAAALSAEGAAPAVPPCPASRSDSHFCASPGIAVKSDSPLPRVARERGQG